MSTKHGLRLPSRIRGGSSKSASLTTDDSADLTNMMLAASLDARSAKFSDTKLSSLLQPERLSPVARAAYVDPAYMDLLNHATPIRSNLRQQATSLGQFEIFDARMRELRAGRPSSENDVWGNSGMYVSAEMLKRSTQSKKKPAVGKLSEAEFMNKHSSSHVRTKASADLAGGRTRPEHANFFVANGGNAMQSRVAENFSRHQPMSLNMPARSFDAKAFDVVSANASISAESVNPYTELLNTAVETVSLSNAISHQQILADVATLATSNDLSHTTSEQLAQSQHQDSSQDRELRERQQKELRKIAASVSRDKSNKLDSAGKALS